MSAPGGWALFVLSRQGTGLLPFDAPLDFLAVIAIGTFTGPALAGLIVTIAIEGRAGAQDLLRRLLLWRVGPIWYAVVFLGLPAIETLGALAMPGVAGTATPIDLPRELAEGAVFFVYPALFCGPLGEEIGWRGIALPKLQALYGPATASLILGLLWAFWHAPIWFSGQWSQPNAANIAVYVSWVVGVTFIFTWVFNRTRGSVLIAVLLHGVMDVFPNVFLLPHLPGLAEMTRSGVLALYWGLAAAFGAAALLLLAVTRRRLGAP